MPDPNNTITTSWEKNDVPDSQTTRQGRGESVPDWRARHMRLVRAKIGLATLKDVPWLDCEDLGLHTTIEDGSVDTLCLAHLNELAAAMS